MKEEYKPERQPLTYRFYTIKDGVTDLDFLEGYPWINTSVEGVLNKIERPRPRDDFFAYANYDISKDIVVPEGMIKYGGPIYSSDVIINERLDSMIGEEDGEYAAVAEMLKSGAKEVIAADIAETLEYDEARIKEYFSTKEMFHNMITPVYFDGKGDGEISVQVYLNTQEPDLFGGLWLAQTDDKTDDFIEGLKAIAEAEEVYVEDISELIDTALDLEERMLEAVLEDENDAFTMTIGEADDAFTGLYDIKSALKEIGYNDDTVVTFDDELLVLSCVIDEFVEENGYDALRKWIALSKIHAYRKYIGIENYLELYRGSLSESGLFIDPTVGEETTEEEYVENYIKNKYADMLSRDYSLRYVSDELRDTVSEIIVEVIEEYKSVIEETDWLGETTKNNAISKLDAMTYVTFYDDDLLDISYHSDGTDIIKYEHDIFDNALAFYDRIDFGGLFTLPTYTMNAVYLPTRNSFIIAHGLFTPYTEEDFNKEFLYGSVGVVVGHEISHGFDSSGSNYDKDGVMNDWWTPEDKATFKQKVDKMVDYYEKVLNAFDGLRLNGSIENTEVTADMGGVKVMLRLANKIEGFDYDVFFRTIANFFSYVYSYDGAVNDVKKNEHPLSFLRVNVTLAQFDEFVEFYGVEEGDGMYIPESERVKIW